MKRPRCTAEIAGLRRRAVPILQQAGFDVAEISTLLNCYANNYAQRPGVRKPDAVRTATMAGMFRDGKTLEYIGAQFGISRERVRVILKHAGVTRTEGGAAKWSKDRRSRAAQKRDESAMRRWGCTHAQRQELQALQTQAKTRELGPIGAFARQKVNALTRGIGWNLTLWQWWTIWHESGQWENRGRRKGQFCMSRIADTGSYEAGNVRIVTVEENIAEAYVTSPLARRKKNSVYRDDLGMTKRERAYFDLAQTGLPPKEIASRLGVSSHTVSCMMVSLRKRARFAMSQETAA